jgi:hypothetical protein
MSRVAVIDRHRDTSLVFQRLPSPAANKADAPHYSTPAAGWELEKDGGHLHGRHHRSRRFATSPVFHTGGWMGIGGVLGRTLPLCGHTLVGGP